MAKQIIYTSVPRGLVPGQSGYTIAARHRDIRERVVESVQRASSYSYAGQSDAPVIFSHRIYRFGADAYHVLSRIVDAGSDYTGRTNYLAHHLVCDQNEILQLEATPADILASFSWPDRFSGEARFLADDEQVSLHNFGPRFALPAVQWAKLRGHAGDGGLLIGEVARERGVLCMVNGIKDSEQLLGLFGESLRALHLVEGGLAAWSIPFTTLIQESAEPGNFSWIGSIPESAASRRSGARLRLEMSHLNVETPSGYLAQVAATGQAPIRTVTGRSVSLADPDLASPDEEVRAAAIETIHPSAVSLAPQVTEAPSAFARLATSREDRSETGRRAPLALILGIVMSLIFTGISGYTVLHIKKSKEDALRQKNLGIQFTRLEESADAINNEITEFCNLGESGDDQVGRGLNILTKAYSLRMELRSLAHRNLAKSQQEDYAPCVDELGENVRRIQDKIIELVPPGYKSKELERFISNIIPKDDPFPRRISAKLNSTAKRGTTIAENQDKVTPPTLMPAIRPSPERILIPTAATASSLTIEGEIPWSDATVTVSSARDSTRLTSWIQNQVWGTEYKFRISKTAEQDVATRKLLGIPPIVGPIDIFLEDLKALGVFKIHFTDSQASKREILAINGPPMIWIFPLDGKEPVVVRPDSLSRIGSRIFLREDLRDFLGKLRSDGKIQTAPVTATWMAPSQMAFGNSLKNLIQAQGGQTGSWVINAGAMEEAKRLNGLREGKIKLQSDYKLWETAANKLNELVSQYEETIPKDKIKLLAKLKDERKKLFVKLTGNASRPSAGGAVGGLRVLGDFVCELLNAIKSDPLFAAETSKEIGDVDTKFFNGLKDSDLTIEEFFEALSEVVMNLEKVQNTGEGAALVTSFISTLKEVGKLKNEFQNGNLFHGAPPKPTSDVSSKDFEGMKRFLAMASDESSPPPGEYQVLIEGERIGRDALKEPGEATLFLQISIPLSAP